MGKSYYVSLYDGRLLDTKEVDKMYEAEKVSIKKTEREEGLVVDTVVSKIEEGTLGKFIKDKEAYAARATSNVNWDQECIQITTENGAQKRINRFPDDKYGPKSTMAAWLKTYKSAPKVGQKIQTVTNESGFYEVVLRQ